MENKRIFEVDGNQLVEDLNNDTYFIIFENFECKKIKSEIPKEVFKAYLESKNSYKKNQNEEERHWEQSKLTEITLYKRANQYQKSIEATIIENEAKKDIQIAISKLPVLQEKRIHKYYFENKNEYKIALEENATQQAVNKTLKNARKKLKEILNKKFRI